MKNLQELIELLPGAEISGECNLWVTDIAYDSRKVTQGALFICLVGSNADGHNYIRQAKEIGAVAVIAEKAVDIQGITVISVSDTRTAMQEIAPYFFDYPSRQLRVIGITGTNGKTTTTYLMKSALEEAGYKTGVIGTIRTMIGNQSFPVKNTTPDVIDLQRLLAEMAKEDVDYVIMEVSSHALALNRIAGCEFDVAIFTNMTREHMDFHGTFENYAKAKSLLFKSLQKSNAFKAGKSAVINADDPAGEIMQAAAACKVVTYGINNQADIIAENISVGARGASFILKTDQEKVPVNLKITGKFNIYNVLGAVGALMTEGIDIYVIKKAMENFSSVDGRFELVDAGQDFAVIVDYAHTPDGLENILNTAKQFAQNNIILVFGCGGDRDRTKRPIMGKLAAKYADIVIATSDNPRSEDPEAILAEIEAGILAGLTPGSKYEKLVDRKQAIKWAIELAETDDIVIIAGKGHETYQILKDRTIDFDDRLVVRELLGE